MPKPLFGAVREFKNPDTHFGGFLTQFAPGFFACGVASPIPFCPTAGMCFTGAEPAGSYTSWRV